MTFQRRQLLLATTALAFGLALGPVAAQTAAPAGTPLRVIMPFSPGSGVDTIIRAAQPGLVKAFNRPVVIENLPGAGGITGTAQLVKAALSPARTLVAAVRAAVLRPDTAGDELEPVMVAPSIPEP